MSSPGIWKPISCVFQAILSDVPQDMLNWYMSDILDITWLMLFFSKSQECMPHSVSSAASAQELLSSLVKCQFHAASVCFLGYIIVIDPAKFFCVASGKQMQHFLRFAKFYCQFIHDYSDITAPLRALICNKVLLDSGHRRGFSVP